MNIFIIITLVFLTVVQLTTSIIFMVCFAQLFGITISIPNPFKKKQVDEVTEEKVPLSEFKPDFTKPINIVKDSPDELTEL